MSLVQLFIQLLFRLPRALVEHSWYQNDNARPHWDHVAVDATWSKYLRGLFRAKTDFKMEEVEDFKVSKGAKIRNRCNQVPHLTQDTNGKVTNSQLDATNENQEVSPFQAGDHKVHINRSAQRHSKHKTEKNIKDPLKKYRIGTVCKILYWRA